MLKEPCNEVCPQGGRPVLLREGGKIVEQGASAGVLHGAGHPGSPDCLRRVTRPV